MAEYSNLYAAIPNASNAGVTVATINGTKTLLQVATPSTEDISILSYWVGFDASAAATPVKVELIEVDVAATVTSLTPTKWNNSQGPASLCVGGTSATGYNATAEGTITASRLLDYQMVPPTSGIVIQFPLGARPYVPVSRFLRIRVTAGAVYNVTCGVTWME